jgi:hypothetical protein
MNWTKQAPTVAGWWWMKEFSLPRIVQIVLLEGELYILGEEESGWLSNYKSSRFEWAGPIPEPGEGITREQPEGSKIASDLRAMASQENCDGEPWDTMMKAAEVIDRLTCQWQPIETAPKDGTVVDLLIAGKRFVDCWWRKDEGAWDCDGGYSLHVRSSDPTHWMPIPEGPEGGEG